MVVDWGFGSAFHFPKSWVATHNRWNQKCCSLPEYSVRECSPACTAFFPLMNKIISGNYLGGNQIILVEPKIFSTKICFMWNIKVWQNSKKKKKWRKYLQGPTHFHSTVNVIHWWCLRTHTEKERERETGREKGMFVSHCSSDVMVQTPPTPQARLFYCPCFLPGSLFSPISHLHGLPPPTPTFSLLWHAYQTFKHVCKIYYIAKCSCLFVLTHIHLSNIP